MKRIIILMIIASSNILFNPALSAEEFLGVQLMSGGEIGLKTESRLEMTAPYTHDEIVQYYKETLKIYDDIKFRDWEDSTYIEDDGKLAWHSITVSKESKNGTSIIIMKDNWTWIIGTLILRFIGVFGVLCCLYAGMSLAGALISKSVKKLETS